MPNVAANYPVTSWSGETFRLIPSRFPPVDVYEGIIANDLQAEIVAVENLTNPRLRSLERLQQGAPASGGSDPKLQNWNLAPFAYGNPDGSTFFKEDRPCLELALELQTALAVSVAKRQTFMEATGEAPIGLDMRLLSTPVRGNFWDLRTATFSLSDLDMTQRYQLATELPGNAQGILFCPAERPTGSCLAVLTGDVLERSQQTVHFRYVWDGQRIAQLYAFDKEGTRIKAGGLSGREDVLTAA